MPPCHISSCIKDFHHAASESNHQIFGYSHSHQTKIPPPPPPQPLTTTDHHHQVTTTTASHFGDCYFRPSLFGFAPLVVQRPAEWSHSNDNAETGEGSGNDGRTRLPSHGDYQDGKVQFRKFRGISKVPVLQKTKTSTKKWKKNLSSYLVTIFFVTISCFSYIQPQSDAKEHQLSDFNLSSVSLQSQKWKAENQGFALPHS